MSGSRAYLHRLQRWWHSPLARVALVLGVGAHLAGFLLFRVVADPVKVEQEPRAFIVWNGPENEGAGSLIRREQSLLLDSEALFLPTTLNAHSSSNTQRLLTPGAALLEQNFRLPVTMELSWADATSGDEPPLTLQSLVARYARNALATYGQVKPATAQMPSGSGALAEVREASTGRSIGEFAIETGEALPPASAGPETVEFMLYRTGAGDIGSLLPLTPSAGGENGKAWSRLIERAEWEKTLPQGYYRIIISP